MRDTLYIGESPAGEKCASLGSDNYYEDSQLILKIWREQIKRELGEPPSGVQLIIKGSPHDFGTYYSLFAKFDDDDAKASAYAYKCECTAEKWDATSKLQLEQGVAPKEKLSHHISIQSFIDEINGDGDY